MKLFLRVLCCFGGVLLLASGCVFSSREVTVSCDESLSQQREYFRNELVSQDGLALESENFLRGNLMQNNFKNNPQLVLKKLDEFYRLSGDPKFLVIAADLCRYLATQFDEVDAVRYNLSCIYYCSVFAGKQRKDAGTGSGGNPGTFLLTQILRDYNEACCGVFSFLKKRDLLDSDSVTLLDAENRRFVLDKPVFKLSVPRESIEDFSLCASYTVNDLMQMNRQTGVGVPLVARIKPQKWYSSLITPPGLTIPVTLLLVGEHRESGEHVLRLVFVDTLLREKFAAQDEDGYRFNVPMALDFSTPLAVFLNSMTQRNLLGQMLNAFEQEATDGLYMIEPYQTGKIPVVFIHGLMSSPETWMQMINSLKNDPTIRQRYQFWFFSYSTGAPVIHSAAKLHDALMAAQKEFCTTPEATEKFNQMVLVGHSMGGLLTRLMVQKEPHYMMEKLLNASWSEVEAKLTPEELKIAQTWVFEPLPFVHRVVFMAVPHRGAEMAQSAIARFGARIIKLPSALVSRSSSYETIARKFDQDSAALILHNRLYTGIDNLDPDNGFVQAIGNSPLKSDLTYHCVIGNRAEDGVPGNSDGVVPYWSSHLNDAASELVVKSGHSVHRTPGAIQEILRILLLHLQTVDKQ